MLNGYKLEQAFLKIIMYNFITYAVHLTKNIFYFNLFTTSIAKSTFFFIYYVVF